MTGHNSTYLWGCYGNVDTKLCAANHEGMDDIVTVPHPCHLQPRQVTKVFLGKKQMFCCINLFFSYSLRFIKFQLK